MLRVMDTTHNNVWTEKRLHATMITVILLNNRHEKKWSNHHNDVEKIDIEWNISTALTKAFKFVFDFFLALFWKHRNADYILSELWKNDHLRTINSFKISLNLFHMSKQILKCVEVQWTNGFHFIYFVHCFMDFKFHFFFQDI